MNFNSIEEYTVCSEEKNLHRNYLMIIQQYYSDQKMADQLEREIEEVRSQGMEPRILCKDLNQFHLNMRKYHWNFL